MKVELVYDSDLRIGKLIFEFKKIGKTYVLPLEEEIVLKLLQDYLD